MSLETYFISNYPGGLKEDKKIVVNSVLSLQKSHHSVIHIDTIKAYIHSNYPNEADGIQVEVILKDNLFFKNLGNRYFRLRKGIYSLSH